MRGPLVLALGVLVLAVLQAPAVQSAEEAAVNRRVEEVYAALNRGDVEGYAAAFHADAVHAIGTTVSVGRTTIEKFVSEPFANGLRLTFTRHATRLLSPTTAIVHGAQEATTATPPTKQHTILTLVKEGNDWLIAALQVGAAPAE